ncbi:hypothetical protein GCK72_021274 [Caenorhabditis remanei]|uniref:F-box domain-containing protein n=1 Tax=Caenorhabditis remanei TaxID=31234 RepID=A0A6A5GHP2_CAERE|nr:hypothetical protein GCK72_021274 [Caenorhabditis remanei]KAF1754710.1 hypothetical protein GCK72_021274 [Caenorhabditis remanei]
MTTPFPLLRLPRLALIRVLQQMKTGELIAISLLSNRARNLIKMLCIKKYVSSVNLHADYLSIEASQRYDEPLELSFNTVSVSSDVTLKWLERVFEVMDCSIEEVDLHGSPQRDDVCEVLTILKEVRGLYIWDNCPNSFAKKALKILTPVTAETVMFKFHLRTKKNWKLL